MSYALLAVFLVFLYVFYFPKYKIVKSGEGYIALVFRGILGWCAVGSDGYLWMSQEYHRKYGLVPTEAEALKRLSEARGVTVSSWARRPK